MDRGPGERVGGHESPFRFGSFELDVRSRELRKGEKSVRLQDQPFEILRMMLERPGHVVTREELAGRLWPDGTFVDFEHSLNAAVKRLRAALGDDADNPRFVETLPRRGYRFIGALDKAESAAAQVRLAVLPFSNLSEEIGQEYFTDGLTEEMIAQLGQLCRGRVGIIARWSSMMFKDTRQRAREIGQALKADYLLEGSVRRDGERVRITARLVESAGETHLWAETYERHLTDQLSVQADVAARIARSLAMELAPDLSPRPHGPATEEAYQEYLKGRYHWNKTDDEREVGAASSLDRALACFARAIEHAPGFAAAHGIGARVHIARAQQYLELPRQALEKARASARRALELDPTLAEGHLAMGDVRRMLEWDWAGAEAAYTQALARNPSHENVHRRYSLMLALQARRADAIREAEHACDLDPLNLVVRVSAALVRYFVGDYETAIQHCDRILDLGPQYLPARRLLGAAYLQTGRAPEALAVLEAAHAEVATAPVVIAWLAHARAVTGDRAGALEMLGRWRALGPSCYLPPVHLALAQAGLGEIDAAFAALEQARADGDPALAYLAVEPRFEPLRADSRYSRLIDQLGL